MNIISKLILKDVRCFEGRNEFNIRPLTFLVGENSTGKSTALGCFQALSDFVVGQEGDIDFNKEPYQMGAFADITRRTKRFAKSFELGFEYENKQYILTLIAREDGSEPVIQQIKNIYEDGEIIIKIEKTQNGKLLNQKEETNIEQPENNKFFSIKESSHFNMGPFLPDMGFMIEEPENNKFILSIKDSSRFNRTPFLPDIGFMLRTLEGEVQDKKISSAHKNLMVFLEKIEKREHPKEFSLHSLLSDSTYSFAPIRSKPERTYNPLKETASPEGSEMPMVLMNLSKSNEEEWGHLKNRLEDFGKASGLFTAIGVRKLGRSTNDPFQLQIKVRGPKRNLMDVGYGISQILPILVRILTKRGRFLLQQPEVHLHPKGQAELVSLLVNMKNERENSFVVETHSDAMINRAQIEIMNKRIKPEDVSLIYLEPSGNKVKVHNISFDEQANMSGVPGSYRDFFLKEEDKLLGFGD